LEVLNSILVGCLRLRGVDLQIKKSGWGQLPRITNDGDLVRPQDRTNGVLGSELAGFVEDQDIKGMFPGSEALSNHQRAHQEAGLDGANRIEASLKKAAKRCVAALSTELILQELESIGLAQSLEAILGLV
jgi:hypothetical protein